MPARTLSPAVGSVHDACFEPRGDQIASGTPSTVFLFDVDNTLLDHDRENADLREHLDSVLGRDRARGYWELFEQIRIDLGYNDYLGAWQRYRLENPHEPQLLAVSYFLLGYPFADRLFPASLDAVQHAERWGAIVILSDGDIVFQARKIYKAGMYDRFRGNVLLYIHKERELADVEARFPADHYVVIDDKVHILAAIKEIWKTRVTTVFVRQGHYAFDTASVGKYRRADITIEHIGEFRSYDLPEVLRAAGR